MYSTTSENLAKNGIDLETHSLKVVRAKTDEDDILIGGEVRIIYKAGNRNKGTLVVIAPRDVKVEHRKGVVIKEEKYEAH